MPEQIINGESYGSVRGKLNRGLNPDFPTRAVFVAAVASADPNLNLAFADDGRVLPELGWTCTDASALAPFD